MTKCVKWDIDADVGNVRNTAIELRGKVVRNVYLKAFSSPAAAKSFLDSPRTSWRSRCLEKAEMFHGKDISGTIVEIGAGTGWCSAVLSRKQNVDKVYALDYDTVSVDELMPIVFNQLEADKTKIIRVIGSYNAMNLNDNTVDCVVSIGALHHSENLQSTLTECSRILRPGGILIASEPCYPNCMSVTEQCQRENEILERSKIENLYGEDLSDIRAIDNSDHFYRLAEYEVAANKSGLDSYAYVFDASYKSGGRLALISRYLRDNFIGDRLFSNRITYQAFSKIIAYPYYAKKVNGKPVYDPLLLILIKPDV